MMDFISKLDAIFSNLEDKIAYLNLTKTSVQYNQESKVVIVNDAFFDFKKSRFISARTIFQNKSILNKLSKYKDDHLINFIPTETGFDVFVYDHYGNLTYKSCIRFFDKGFLGFITHLRLKFKYPNLLS